MGSKIFSVIILMLTAVCSQASVLKELDVEMETLAFSIKDVFFLNKKVLIRQTVFDVKRNCRITRNHSLSELVTNHCSLKR